MPSNPPEKQINEGLILALRRIVGRSHVLTGVESTRRYRAGFRFGTGKALAVVRPGGLLEQWKVVKACVEAGKIVIMQAANTGLTGGSTPYGDDYDRDIVVVSTLRMKKIHLLHKGRQVICFPGATLDQLERTLQPLGREPHSVIGSSCIGASVFGGVCNNSGGALVQRGPAYTEMSLFAQVDGSGQLRLVNHLGVQLGTTPEEILERLDRHDYTDADIAVDAGKGHDHDYGAHVRDVHADTPARYNADAKRLHEASGCAGKLVLFAVRLDTFPADKDTTDFYIGTNDTAELTAIRREILANFPELPVSGEYIHRDAFDIGEKYGKDTFLAIQVLGTKRIPMLFAVKGWLDALFSRLRFMPRHCTDRLMQFAASLLPGHLPRRMKLWRARYEHHLILKVAARLVPETQGLLKRMFPSRVGDYFQCTREEGEKAFRHRFAVAGAAVRYRAIHFKEVQDIVALDIALKRNEANWFERLPQELLDKMVIKLYYGHFFCHVFHQDYVVKKGASTNEVEHQMLRLLDARGAEYPAEHNVGHLYNAKPALREFYRMLDPSNSFNPGIGCTSKMIHWGGCPADPGAASPRIT